MTEDTTKQLKNVALTTALIGAIFTAGVWLTPEPQPAPPVIRLVWDKNEPEAVTEVWGTTNIVDWYPVTNVAGAEVTLPATKAQEFFKVRNKLGNQVSDWARK